MCAAALTSTIFGLEGPALLAREADFFRESRPWGFILFARNVENPEQLRRLTGSLREAVGYDAPILIDQEGGRVARLRPPFWRGWAAPLRFAEACAPEHLVRALWIRYRLIAAELRDVGIDVNCAPMLDVPTPSAHEIITDRCYGKEARVIAAAGRAVVDGLLAGGVLPVVKHMPGHGRAEADSHLELPVVQASQEALREQDFLPFRALNDLPLAMTAHVVYTAYDATAPATTSQRMMQVMRSEIGFQGLIMSDDLSMEALSGSYGARALACLDAGVDLLLHCNGNPQQMAEIASVAPPLNPKQLRKSTAALEMRAKYNGDDLKALARELDALILSP